MNVLYAACIYFTLLLGTTNGCLLAGKFFNSLSLNVIFYQFARLFVHLTVCQTFSNSFAFILHLNISLSYH